MLTFNLSHERDLIWLANGDSLKWQESRVIGLITQQAKNLNAHVILNKRKLLYIKTSVSEVQNTYRDVYFVFLLFWFTWLRADGPMARNHVAEIKLTLKKAQFSYFFHLYQQLSLRCHFPVRILRYKIWSNYRMQGHFGSPVLLMSKSFEQRSIAQ